MISEDAQQLEITEKSLLPMLPIQRYRYIFFNKQKNVEKSLKIWILMLKYLLKSNKRYYTHRVDGVRTIPNLHELVIKE